MASVAEMRKWFWDPRNTERGYAGMANPDIQMCKEWWALLAACRLDSMGTFITPKDWPLKPVAADRGKWMIQPFHCSSDMTVRQGLDQLAHKGAEPCDVRDAFQYAACLWGRGRQGDEYLVVPLVVEISGYAGPQLHPVVPMFRHIDEWEGDGFLPSDGLECMEVTPVGRNPSFGRYPFDILVCYPPTNDLPAVNP
jgi:hypothetical protein